MAKKYAKAGLILGIISSLCSWFGLIFGIICLIAAVFGIVFSVKARKNLKAEGEPCGVATAGLVLSIIGVILSCIGIVSCSICYMGLYGAMGDSEVQRGLAELRDSLNSISK